MPASATPPCCPPVAAAASAILDQCARFIQAMPEGVYARESATLKGGSSFAWTAGPPRRAQCAMAGTGTYSPAARTMSGVLSS